MSIANPFLHQAVHNAEQARIKKLATLASVSVALILIAAKLSTYLATGSVSLLSSLLDSTIDAVVSITTMISVRHALEPADSAHRYGHGKLESLAALAQAVFIAGSAIFLFYESLNRFVNPHPIENTLAGILVMLFSIAMTMGLVAYQKRAIAKTASIAIAADSLHYKGDILLNLSVIAALFLGGVTGWPHFDPLFALVIAGVLVRSALAIGRTSFDVLMDRELAEEERQKIAALVSAHAEVHSIHDLRTRSTGQQIFIEFHIEMDGDMPLSRAHDVTEQLEMEIYNAFPNAEVIIHQEPAGMEHDRLDLRVENPKNL